VKMMLELKTFYLPPSHHNTNKKLFDTTTKKI
jgi:hypothetical protein